jgi:hypothetical protein
VRPGRAVRRGLCEGATRGSGALAHGPPQAMPEHLPMLSRVGSYVTIRSLGMGGTGQAVLAYDARTGQRVCVKLCSGAEGFVFDWLEGVLPPQLLRVHEWGVLESPPGHAWLWVARELADETWADYRGHSERRPRIDEALEVFASACQGVAALHDAGVYHWSAHERNVYRVGDTWKLGDLGRCVMAATADDPRFRRLYRADALTGVQRSALLDTVDAGPWRGSDSCGAFLWDSSRERRLRLDDCAMLAGTAVRPARRRPLAGVPAGHHGAAAVLEPLCADGPREG